MIRRDPDSTSALWNAVETLISAWAHDLEEGLEKNTQPNWVYLASDLSAAQGMVNVLASRQSDRPVPDQQGRD